MDTNERITPSRQALAEALQLSSEILRNIELSEINLGNVALKAARLARLLNDFQYEQIFAYEAGGYPSGPQGIALEVWNLGRIAERVYLDEDSESHQTQEFMYMSSIDSLEEGLRANQTALSAAQDPNISISSANPNQYVSAPSGTNRYERFGLRNAITLNSDRLASRRKFIYQYTLQKHYELKFSSIPDDELG
jgi:hypothetical protein